MPIAKRLCKPMLRATIFDPQSSRKAERIKMVKTAKRFEVVRGAS